MTVTSFKVQFSYKPLTAGSHKVFIAGDFNNWCHDTHQMKESNGIYEIELELQKGIYQYKFVVDGHFVTDENAEDYTADNFGGLNSLVIIGKPEDINSLHRVTITYKPERIVKSIHLVGAFNSWNKCQDIMMPDLYGNYTKTIYVRAGVYHYKLLINNNNWTHNPEAEENIEDGTGGKESVITVDSRFPVEKICRGNGKIITYGLFSDNDFRHFNLIEKDIIEVRTRAYKNDVKDVYLSLGERVIKLDYQADDSLFSYYSTYLKTNEIDFSHEGFLFIYNEGLKELYLGTNGFSEQKRTCQEFSVKLEDLEFNYVPEWVRDGIFYQIFCDRFYNGNKENDPDFHEWYYQKENRLSAAAVGNKYSLVKEWSDITPLQKNEDGVPDYNCFYGGDIAGVKEKLPYLEELGITIIYFNPLAQAESNHKYDTADYFRVDPHFASNKEFREFVDLCHLKGIRIIVDFAFNHTGTAFFAFHDSLQNGKNSPYFHWYEWRKFPPPEKIDSGFNALDYYQCWWGHPTLPDLDFDKSRPHPHENDIKDISEADVNWDVVNHLLQVAEFWLTELDIDGFRLDVPNEVPYWFWEIFRKKVKSVKHDAYLIGEIWHDAVQWVNDKYFDAVMNYAYFKDPVMKFFCRRKGNAEKFLAELMPGLLHYSVPSTQAMMNLLDSHDTYRFLEASGRDIDRLRLAVLFQMTFVGAPHIWYGDEIAMTGSYDPDNRRPFNWNYSANPEAVLLYDYYKKLINIRKGYKSLRRGSFIPALATGAILAYYRVFLKEKILIVINNSLQPYQFNLELTITECVDILVNEKIAISESGKIVIPPMQGRIIPLEL